MGPVMLKRILIPIHPFSENAPWEKSTTLRLRKVREMTMCWDLSHCPKHTESYKVGSYHVAGTYDEIFSLQCSLPTPNNPEKSVLYLNLWMRKQARKDRWKRFPSCAEVLTEELGRKVCKDMERSSGELSWGQRQTEEQDKTGRQLRTKQV